MAFKGAIFDIDGVIVDTVPLHFFSWKRLFESDYGIPFTYEIYQKYVDGKSRFDALQTLLPKLSSKELAKAQELKQKYFLEAIADKGIKKFDDAIYLIDDLTQHNVTLAAASSSKNAALILKTVKLLPKFKKVIAGNGFKRGKPDPEIFLNAAAAINLKVKECVVFEDSVSGIQAAKAGKFFCVGVDRHNFPNNYVSADLHVNTLKEVNYDRLERMLSYIF